MKSRFAFFILRLRERLWVKPLVYCLFAVAAAFLARTADYLSIDNLTLEISQETTEKLLTIISSTMLAVATFAVGSMLSAYGSASSKATPRAFALVVTDDVSKTALSSFIGAFIFSIVAIIALKTGYYGRSGNFVLFLMTLAMFGWVIFTFVRWVDSIARLGRVGTTINKVEAAAHACLTKQRKLPFLGGVAKNRVEDHDREPIYADKIGYVQHIDMDLLQRAAKDLDKFVTVDALPGTFLAPGRPVAFVDLDGASLDEAGRTGILGAFLVGDERTFEEDPRFGLIVLSEIAARALSPAVNDPGTGIAIVGRFVRLFADWAAPLDRQETCSITYDRIGIPELCVADMFDDAFTAIARDGAGSVEVGIRLQKAFQSLASLDNRTVRDEASRHSQLALARAEEALQLPDDFRKIRDLAAWSSADAG